MPLKCSPDAAVVFEVKETILAATLRIGYQEHWYLKRKISNQKQFRLSQTIQSFCRIPYHNLYLFIQKFARSGIERHIFRKLAVNSLQLVGFKNLSSH